MIAIADLETHLNNIPLEEWEPLFMLIPKIKNETHFGELVEPKHEKDENEIVFSHWLPSQIVNQFISETARLDIIPVFNWQEWTFGHEILVNDTFDYSVLDKIALCKVLTCILRSDRFNEGYLISCFKDGKIEKILIGLEKQIKGVS